jgi:hypothetical protein
VEERPFIAAKSAKEIFLPYACGERAAKRSGTKVYSGFFPIVRIARLFSKKDWPASYFRGPVHSRKTVPAIF